jgi:peptidoglycan/LPS O-acetylase OafA/YrhL
MISGFVILMTAAGGSLRRFVISRFVRLYPAFWACCTITFAAIAMIGAPRYSASVSQYLINMTMLSGFVGVPSIDGAYWSLFVEIQFYGLVVALLLIRRIHQAEVFLACWLAAAIALEIFPVGKLRFLLIVDYAAFFIAGAAFFQIWSQGLSPRRVALVALSWSLAIFQSIRGLPDFEKHFNESISAYVVAGIITAYFLAMLLVSLKRTGPLGRNRWILAGALTYPLYLLHQTIGFMIFNAAYPAINQHLLFWGTISLTLGAAFAVHHLVEKRFSSTLKHAIDGIADRMIRQR